MFGWPLEHEGWSLHLFKLRLDFMHNWKKVGLEENPKNNCTFFNEIWWKNNGLKGFFNYQNLTHLSANKGYMNIHFIYTLITKEYHLNTSGIQNTKNNLP